MFESLNPTPDEKLVSGEPFEKKKEYTTKNSRKTNKAPCKARTRG
jgi:hypothetical protein